MPDSLKSLIVRDTLAVRLNPQQLTVDVRGGFVVGAQFPGDPVLLVRGSTSERVLTFMRSRTPRYQRLHPNGKNADRARIETNSFDIYELPLHLFIQSEDGSRSEYVRTLDLDDLRASRDAAMMEIYARHMGENKSPTLFKKLQSHLARHPEVLSTRIARAWLYGLFKRKPNAYANYMAAIQREYERQNIPTRFKALEEQHALHGITSKPPHGEQFLGARESADLWKSYDMLAAKLKELGLTVFLNSGTLLGVHRDGDFLPHDDDIDVAVLLSAATEAEAAREFRSLQDILDKAGLLDEKARHLPGILKLARIDGVQVDLFPAWFDSEGRVFVYPHTYGTVFKEDILDLRPWNDLSHTLVPKDPEPLLESNYGKRWMIPNPYFRFSWPKARRQFSEFIDVARGA